MSCVPGGDRAGRSRRPVRPLPRPNSANSRPARGPRTERGANSRSSRSLRSRASRARWSSSTRGALPAHQRRPTITPSRRVNPRAAPEAASEIFVRSRNQCELRHIADGFLPPVAGDRPAAIAAMARSAAGMARAAHALFLDASKRRSKLSAPPRWRPPRSSEDPVFRRIASGCARSRLRELCVLRFRSARRPPRRSRPAARSDRAAAGWRLPRRRGAPAVP